MSANGSSIAESCGAPSSAANTSSAHLRVDDIPCDETPVPAMKTTVRGDTVANGGTDVLSFTHGASADSFLRRTDPLLLPGNVNIPSATSRRVRPDPALSDGCAASQRSAPPSASPARSASVSSQPASGYDTGVRALLVAAERELAEARETAARRGMELDALRLTLSRDRAAQQTAQSAQDTALAALRAEHAEDVTRLREQVVALTQVAEGAMQERARAADEAARRKAQLLSLLDREREEKSQIMADYRQQTETLIAEQGREITSQRAELRTLRAAHDQLLAERAARDEADRRQRDDCAAAEQRLRDELAAAREDAGAQVAQMERRLEQLGAEAQQRAAQAAARGEADDAAREAERRQMDGVLHALRADAAAALEAKAQASGDADVALRECERLKEALEAATREAEEARARLREEVGAREEAVSEMHGTVRVLTARLASYDDDTQRLQEEVAESNAKLHDAHTLLGKKDAAIGQLTARLRAYESRMGPL